MAYATRADLVPAYVSERELATGTNSGSGTATEEDADVTAAFLAAADAEIDAYVGFVYPLPLVAPYPALLVALACRIARYRLNTSGGNQPADWVTADYQAALKQLGEIRDGRASLGLATGASAVTTTPTAAVRASSLAPRFGRSKLQGY